MILEPWAEEFEMSPGKTFEFVGEGEKEGNFEIDFDDSAITVFGWESSTVKIFCDGEELGSGAANKLAVPAFSKNQSISSFLKSWFYEKR